MMPWVEKKEKICRKQVIVFSGVKDPNWSFSTVKYFQTKFTLKKYKTNTQTYT